MSESKTFLDEIRFDDPEPKRVSVVIGPNKYVLIQGSAKACDYYRTEAMLRSLKFRDGTATSKESMAELQSMLVSLCLHGYKRTPDGKDQTDEVSGLIPMNIIQSWRGDIVEALWNRAMRISGLLDDDATVESLTKELRDVEARIRSKKEEDERLGKSSKGTGDGTD